MKKYFGIPLYEWVINAIGIIVSNIITDQFVRFPKIPHPVILAGIQNL